MRRSQTASHPLSSASICVHLRIIHATIGIGMLALFSASIASNTGLLLLCVVMFFLCGVGATVVMHAEAGTRGSRSVAGYVTASDLGSATGPMLGWMTQQVHLPSDWIFLIGGGMYAIGALVITSQK